MALCTITFGFMKVHTSTDLKTGWLKKAMEFSKSLYTLSQKMDSPPEISLNTES